MKQNFELHKATRSKLLHYLEILTPEQLAFIPEKFSNNIFWNIAHCVATQQILCYKLSGATPLVANDFIEKFKKGTFPQTQLPDNQSITELKELLVSTQQQLEIDYNNGVFKNFTPYATSYGFELLSVEDAILFNNSHESMHLGVVISLNYFQK